MPKKFDKAAQRARLEELRAQRAGIEAVSVPLRVARDAFVAETSAKERAMNAEIKAAEKGLGDLAQEIAFLTRASVVSPTVLPTSAPAVAPPRC